MTYHVNSIFKTIQGEGYWTGRTAVFCRFSRCNLWTGREADRGRAVCQFCDTDFTASTTYETDRELKDAIVAVWPEGEPNPMVVFTGGEPLLQLDHVLAQGLNQLGWYIAVETNGTVKPPTRLIDWLCVSPKVNATLVIHSGQELKLVYPQGPDPSPYLGLDFKHFWLSPMDGPNLAENTRQAVDYVLAHPQWRLNVQTHKMIGVD